MNIINNNYTIQYISDPYPIWIIDNFLDSNSIIDVIKEWPDNDDPKWHCGHPTIDGKTNPLEQGMRGISKREDMPHYIGKIIDYFHSTDFCKIISDITGIDNLEPDTSMRWSGLRVMLPNSFQLIHSDARFNPETGYRKELTCLMYLNPNYSKDRDEGCLEIWTDDMSKRTHEIEPIYNRMTIFLNSDTSYHGVPVVKSDRRAITFSILKKGDVGERSKALFVKRPQDSEEIRSIGIQRSNIQDKHK